MSSSEGEEDLVEQELRPSFSSIQKNFDELFKNPLVSLPYLKDQAIKGDIKSLKSLHWRFFFSLLPIQTTNYKLILERSRNDYAELRNRFLRSPDESEASGKKYSRNDVNNPLSLDIESPWVDWFDSLELRRVIMQDVERTFQELPYFRLDSTKKIMADILLVYAKLVPEISYKQGMNELLALILLAVDYDSLPSTTSSEATTNSLSKDYVEHDSWSLFFTFMKSVKQFYDYTPSVSIPVERVTSTQVSTFSSPSSPLSPPSTTLVQPLVATSIRIYDQILKTVDPLLWRKMESMKIEPQLWLTKWLRLLFLREFPDRSSIYRLWTALFAEDPSLRLVEYISVVMILRIREALLSTEDYSEFLMLLLRYPLPKDKNPRISLLIEQSIYLRDHPTSSAGEKIRIQNLEIGANAGKVYSSPIIDQRRLNSVQSGVGLSGEGGRIVGDIAKGVYETAEAFGLNKALFGTLNEIRRGVAAQNQRSPQGDYSGFPSSLPLPPPPSLPLPSSPLNDHLVLVNQMRDNNIAMGKALEICISSLQLNVGTESETSGEQSTALTVLAHIRDVLSGTVSGGFDKEVLKPLLQQRSTMSTTSPPLPSSISASSSIPRSEISVTIPTSSIPVIKPGEPNLLLGNRSYKPQASLSRTPQSSSKPPPSSNPSIKLPTSILTRSSTVNRPPLPPISTIKTSSSDQVDAGISSRFPPSGFSTRSGVPNNSRQSEGGRKSIGIDPLGVLGSK